MEEWKEYNKTYEVSNLGRVRRKETKRIKKPIDHGGYLYVNLSDKGKTKSKSIHRLVAETFIPNPNNLREVDHINCNKYDNRVQNLSWVTSSENKLRAIDNGLYENNKKYWLGERKPIIAIDIKTKEEKRYISINQAEKVYGKHIVDVLKGRRTQTHGYFFFYEER